MSALSQLLNGKSVIDHKVKKILNPEETTSCTDCGEEPLAFDLEVVVCPKWN